MAQILLQKEIPLMRAAGKLAAQTLIHVEPYIQPGVTGDEINKICHDFILSHAAVPAPLHYKGFPKSVCVSVNDCICHGAPDGEALKDGDIVNVDVTCIKDGFHGDTSKTFFVGASHSKRACDLAECAFQAMHKGIEAVRPFGRTGDIGFAVNRYVTRKGFFPVEEIGGHGIGRVFHDDPFVPSTGKKGKGELLLPWSCITVEPMINELSSEVQAVPIPGSSIPSFHTADGGLSAQFEHTVLITDGKEGRPPFEILTLP